MLIGGLNVHSVLYTNWTFKFHACIRAEKIENPAFYQHRIEDAPIDLPITNEIYIHSKAAKKKKKNSA